MTTTTDTARIRDLNDAFRRTGNVKFERKLYGADKAQRVLILGHSTPSRRREPTAKGEVPL